MVEMVLLGKSHFMVIVWIGWIPTRGHRCSPAQSRPPWDTTICEAIHRGQLWIQLWFPRGSGCCACGVYLIVHVCFRLWHQEVQFPETLSLDKESPNTLITVRSHSLCTLASSQSIQFYRMLDQNVQSSVSSWENHLPRSDMYYIFKETFFSYFGDSTFIHQLPTILPTIIVTLYETSQPEINSSNC